MELKGKECIIELFDSIVKLDAIPSYLGSFHFNSFIIEPGTACFVIIQQRLTLLFNLKKSITVWFDLLIEVFKGKGKISNPNLVGER